MQDSDRLGCAIILGGLGLIGGTYLMFRLFGDSYLISLIFLAGWVVIVAATIKFFAKGKK